jgi:hypothetical protein
MPISCHISRSLADPAHPFVPINSVILRPPDDGAAGAPWAEGAVFACATGNVAAARAVSVCNARRRPGFSKGPLLDIG